MHLLTIIIAGFACSKEEKPSAAKGNLLKSGSAGDFPYEIYEPTGEGEIYEQLEDGLVELFDPNNTATTINITKGVWLWEAGVNYLHRTDTLINNPNIQLSPYGDRYETERTVILTKDSVYITTAALKDEIETTYDGIESNISNGDFAHLVTDVHFVSETETSIVFMVTSVFTFIDYLTYVPSATVPSAIFDKKAGYYHKCYSISYTSSAWDNMERRVESTFLNNINPYNVVNFSSRALPSSPQYVNDEFLPGGYSPAWPDPDVDHSYPLGSHECLNTNHQDVYAQALRNEIAMKVNSSFVFNTVYWLDVDRGGFAFQGQTANTNTKWWYKMMLSNSIDGALHSLDAGDLF